MGDANAESSESMDQEPTTEWQPVSPRKRRRHHRAGCGCSRVLCVLLTMLSVLYLATVVVIERRFPESYFPTFLLTYIPQLPLLAPLIPPMLVCVIFWQWRLMWVNIAVLIVGVALLAPPVLPQRLPVDDPAQRIRIVTWNAHEEFRNFNRMAKVLEALQPDIVCFQEARSAKFADLLPGAQVAHTHEVTTLVRGRILEDEPYRLGPSPNWRWGMDTLVQLPHGRLRVLNVHYVIDVTGRIREVKNPAEPERTFHTREARALEQRAVLAWMKHNEGPAVVCGDFNTPPNTLYYRQLRAAATNAFAVAGRGWGFTFRRDRPLIRIDHVWCLGGVRPVRSYTVDATVSDHRLLVTDIFIPKGAGMPASFHALKKDTTKPEAGPEDTR